MSKICAKCKETIKTPRTSTSCEIPDCCETYHTKCLDSVSLAKEKNEAIWRCMRCRIQKPRIQILNLATGIDTPVYGTPTNSPGASGPTTFSVGSDILSKLQQDVARVLLNQDTIRAALAEVRQAQADMQKTLTYYGDQLQDLEKTQKEHTSRITNLEKMVPDFNNMKLEISKLRSERDDLEQAALADYVEIKGIPETETNLKDAVVFISKAVKNPIKPTDIAEVTRVMSKKAQKEVRVRFVDNEVRKEFLKSARARRPLTVRTVGLRDDKNEDARIFVNELLTGRKKQLLSNAKTYAKTHNIRFTWVSKGQILMRKTEDSKTAAIRHENDLKSETFFRIAQ